MKTFVRLVWVLIGVTVVYCVLRSLDDALDKVPSAPTQLEAR